jgi:hypothetical protein
MKLSSVHPFPARMAPEIVFKELEALESPLRVLDPMCVHGSSVCWEQKIDGRNPGSR